MKRNTSRNRMELKAGGMMHNLHQMYRKNIADRNVTIGLIVITIFAVILFAMPFTQWYASASVKRNSYNITLAGAGSQKTDLKQIDRKQINTMQIDTKRIDAGKIDNKRIDTKKIDTKQPKKDHADSSLIKAMADSVETAGNKVSTLAADTTKLNAIQSAQTVGYRAMNTIQENQIMTYSDYVTLLQIVEAECTGADETSKLHVANVVLNRTKDEHFPDTVYDVVWQKIGSQAQFSPTQDGRMGQQQISDTTRSAVNRAINGEDNSEGALFFFARESASDENTEWFDKELQYLYSCGGHEFFKYRDTV